MTAAERNIIKRNTGLDYDSLHRYLRKINGNAPYCSNKSCKTTFAKRFEWALKKGRTYSKNIKDYIPLCPSCHRIYDMTEELRKKLSNSKKGIFCGEKNPASRKVACASTGKIFGTVKQAALHAGLKRTTLTMMLNGSNPNKTTLQYYD